MYGVVGMLLALVIINGTVAASYYLQNTQEREAKNQYIEQLKELNSKYNQVASDYNKLLSLYNRTISLLARTIAVVNTTQPVYQEGSRQISHLWGSYLQLKPAATSVNTANILIDFGNGTSRWYNNTQVQPGWNLYITTVVLVNGDVDAQWYPQFGAHFVEGIGGVENTKTEFWFLWTYDKTSSWQLAPVGADQLLVFNGSVYAWTFCGANESYQPTCKP